MQVETMGDVMDWTQRAHARMAECLDNCARDTRGERLRMLLDYLSEHERRLAHVLELSKEDASRQALDTWAQEFFEKAPIKPEEACQEDFHDRDIASILQSVLAMHDKMVELYRYLAEKAHAPSTEQLLNSLLDLEQHEAMRMARDTDMLEDV